MTATGTEHRLSVGSAGDIFCSCDFYDSDYDVMSKHIFDAGVEQEREWWVLRHFASYSSGNTGFSEMNAAAKEWADRNAIKMARR